MKIIVTKQFKKDFKKAKKQKRDLNKLYTVIDRLARGETLESFYRDYALTGYYEGFREFLVEQDWVLIYGYTNNVLCLVLSRLGSHSGLF